MFFSLLCSVLIVLTLFRFLFSCSFSGVMGKKFDDVWGTMLDELSSYLEPFSQLVNKDAIDLRCTL